MFCWGRKEALEMSFLMETGQEKIDIQQHIHTYFPPGWCPRDLAWQSTAVQNPAPCKSWEDSAEHVKCSVLLYWEHLVFANKTCTHRRISQTITFICNLCEHVCICIVWQEYTCYKSNLHRVLSFFNLGRGSLSAVIQFYMDKKIWQTSKN